MRNLIRIVEFGWLIVSIFSIHGIYVNWQEGNMNRLYMFIFTLIVSLFMFFFRRKKRIEYQNRKIDAR